MQQFKSWYFPDKPYLCLHMKKQLHGNRFADADMNAVCGLLGHGIPDLILTQFLPGRKTTYTWFHSRINQNRQEDDIATRQI